MSGNRANEAMWQKLVALGWDGPHDVQARGGVVPHKTSSGRWPKNTPEARERMADGTVLMFVMAEPFDPALPALARWCIEEGADIHATDQRGQTAPWYAHDIRPWLDFMVRHGFDLAHTDHDGYDLLNAVIDTNGPYDADDDGELCALLAHVWPDPVTLAGKRFREALDFCEGVREVEDDPPSPAVALLAILDEQRLLEDRLAAGPSAAPKGSPRL